jgi:2-dehydro-3-deoxyphosphooctonate aldolase (KDO 8-P synthase)
VVKLPTMSRQGLNQDLILIAGPCVIEDWDTTYETALRLKAICGELPLKFIFKSSYDKANRSSINSYRGPGLKKGLEVLGKIKNLLNVPVLTDIHQPEEAAIAAEVVDYLQIPAFLCRQTDLILAASKTGKPVNIKKGQFLAPWDVRNIIEKFTSTGNQNLTITERGTSFGYNNLVVDFRAFPIIRPFGYPVFFDVTHSLQLPGAQGACSGGQREFAFPLARAAVACGVDGLFMEVHPSPDNALCDGPNMLSLKELPELLDSVVAINNCIRGLKQANKVG